MAKSAGQKTSSHVCHHPFPQLRRENAEKRQAEREKRTPKQQLAYLDKLFGPDVGAAKERARLQARIDTAAVEEAREREAKKAKKKGE